eukprot:TRINITY_DN4633_c0_g1_i13.p1 TRINITY_DN4633_c0_g1~~TRINITY_DN4633_c0_g1_i13.p1  ORF type:complete len:317 (+),score=34.85 TRINITY_DN4633_c0_g1_i13:62-1012(+)
MFLDRFLLSPDDTPIDVQRKKLLGPLALVSLVVTVFVQGVSFGWDIGPKHIQVLVVIFGIILFLVKVIITKRLTPLDISLLLLSYTLGLLWIDILRGSSMQERTWPGIVVILDVGLLCSLPNTCHIILFITSIYLLFDLADRILRFGMFSLVSAGANWNELVDCFPNLTIDDAAAIPCKEEPSRAMGMVMSSFAVLVLDFYCTQIFAKGMKEEKKRLEASVSLAETVVTALVNFDLSEAQDRIINAPNTPLTDVLGKMLHNLHQYRPYLPDSLFDNLFDEEGNMLNEVPPPQGPLAAILFTDLKSSTAIWEGHPVR